MDLLNARVVLFSIMILCLTHALAGGRGNGAMAQTSYKETEVPNGGSIRGTVRFVGVVPQLVQLPISKDDKVCGKKKASPRLVVGKNQGVANTIIYLEGITSGKRFPDSSTVTMNQYKCEYSPHILLVPPRSILEIVNSDKVLHNVHTYDVGAQMKTVFNIAQPIVGQRTVVKQKPKNNRGLAFATCDAGHPWMSAYVMYMDNPYCTLTDSNGNFTLEDIPPGSYTLKMWHEGVSITRTEMERESVKKYTYEEPYESIQEITILPGQSKTVTFEFSLR